MRSQNLKRKKGSLHDNDDTGRRKETFKTVLRSCFSQTKRALEPVKEQSNEVKEIATSSVPMNEPNRRWRWRRTRRRRAAKLKNKTWTKRGEKRTANASHNVPGRKKSSESLKTRSFQAMRIWAKVVRSLENPAFFWRTRKRRKRKWKGPRKRTFSRELAGGWRRWRLSPSFKFFHVSLTSFRLVRSRCSHAAHSTPRQSKRYGEQHLSFWLSLLFFSHKPSSPFPSVTDGYDLSFGRSCGSHRSGLERNSSPVVMELGVALGLKNGIEG